MLLKLDGNISKDQVSAFAKRKSIYLNSYIEYLTGEEKKVLVQELKDDPEGKWEKQEEYFVPLISIQLIESRLSVWEYKLGFEEDLISARKGIDILADAFKKLRESPVMKNILAISLALGNVLNGGMIYIYIYIIILLYIYIHRK